MGWTVIENKLTREFDCIDFKSAIQFIQRIARIAEEADHHPDILLYRYKKIKVMLYTQSEFSITEKDYQLASQIDNIYQTMV